MHDCCRSDHRAFWWFRDNLPLLVRDSLARAAQADFKADGIILTASARSHPYYGLYGLAHWVFFCVVGYVVLPVIYLKLCGRRIRDMYLSWSGFSEHIRLYALLYALVMIPVVIVSFSPSYQAIYPFTRTRLAATSISSRGNLSTGFNSSRSSFYSGVCSRLV